MLSELLKPLEFLELSELLELLELLKLLTSKKRGLLFQAFKPGDLLLELRFVF